MGIIACRFERVLEKGPGLPLYLMPRGETVGRYLLFLRQKLDQSRDRALTAEEGRQMVNTIKAVALLGKERNGVVLLGIYSDGHERGFENCSGLRGEIATALARMNCRGARATLQEKLDDKDPESGLGMGADYLKTAQAIKSLEGWFTLLWDCQKNILNAHIAISVRGIKDGAMYIAVKYCEDALPALERARSWSQEIGPERLALERAIDHIRQ